MRWSEGFIAVDWGTTNRRAWLVGGDGRASARIDDDKGVLSVPEGGFEGAVAQIRERLGDKPLLMAGMVGSNRGWIEAPYVACPAGIGELAARLEWIEPGRTAIVPGLSRKCDLEADVMRGEEVQLLGAVAAGLAPADGLACHPGTHNKWVRLQAGRIAAFRTTITGELHHLLARHSILADLLAAPVVPGDGFAAGVERGLGTDELLAELFAIRARVLLGALPADDAAAFTSGLLIGSDLRIGLRDIPVGAVTAIGRPELTVLYAAALEIAGREAREVDGEAAFLAGARELAERIE